MRVARRWVPAVLICVATIDCSGCAHEAARRHANLVDRTHWELYGSITEPATFSVTYAFADGFAKATRTLIRERLVRELTARAFQLQEPARYALSIRCEGPWMGVRGFPVTSRYARVAFVVAVREVSSERLILEGEADGLVEVGEVYWAADPRQDLSKAIVTAIGKIGRQLLSARRIRVATQPVPQEPRGRPHLPARSPSERPNLAVLDFGVARDGEADAGRALADVCRRVIRESEQFTLINREQMKNVLGERDFVALMACEEASCRVRYARVLAAHKLVHGRVSRVGESHVVYLSLTDVGTGRVEANVLAVAEDEISGLIPVVEEKTWDLLVQAVR